MSSLVSAVTVCRVPKVDCFGARSSEVTVNPLGRLSTRSVARRPQTAPHHLEPIVKFGSCCYGPPGSAPGLSSAPATIARSVPKTPSTRERKKGVCEPDEAHVERASVELVVAATRYSRERKL